LDFCETEDSRATLLVRPRRLILMVLGTYAKT